jgi:DNA-binding response OmpR family regulator
MNLIYVVEDDEDINELLVYNLKKEAFEVKPFLNSKEAYNSIKKDYPDLIILDIMLPDIDGLEFCKLLKSERDTEDIPIIMLTAKSTEIDKIVGLELGADDYVTKPFSIRELIARIKAVLKRSKRSDRKNKIIRINKLEIDPSKIEVKIEGKSIDLTAKEFKLLLLLINSEGKVLTRDQILSSVWETDLDVYDRTIDVHVKKLRDKLGKYSKCIKTVRGVGYKWECEGE